MMIERTAAGLDGRAKGWCAGATLWLALVGSLMAMDVSAQTEAMPDAGPPAQESTGSEVETPSPAEEDVEAAPISVAEAITVEGIGRESNSR